MIKEALARIPLQHMSIVGLILFILLFAGAVLWVNRKGSDKVYKHLEEMPLDLDSDATARGGVNE